MEDIIDAKEKRDKSKVEEKMIEGAFKCRKCGSEKLHIINYKLVLRMNL